MECRLSFSIAAAIIGVVFSNAAILTPVNASPLQLSAGGPTGNQDGYNVGVEFSVNAPETFSSIGIFDSNQDGIINASLTAYLINVANPTVALAEGTFNTGVNYTLIGHYRYQSVASVTLLPGNLYFLGGYGWTGTDPEYNQTLGTTLELMDPSLGIFVESRYDTISAVELPSATWPTNVFESANLAGQLAATPLPSTWTLMLIGIAGLGLVACQKRQKLRLVY